MRYERSGRTRQPGGTRTLTQQAMAILAQYGGTLLMPGVGAINGITAGNWQNSAGTIAGAVDQPVGLVVNARSVWGPELVVNGGFDSGLTGWTVNSPVTLTVSGGQAIISRNSASPALFPRQAVVAAGKTYLVSFSVVSRSHNVSVYLGGTEYAVSVIGAASAVLTAGSDGAGLRIGPTGDVAATCTLDNISVREITGNHATQPTAANRPFLRQVNGLFSWQFDGSNDSFATAIAPGNAGFICTAANISDAGTLRTLLGAGAGSDASSGVWLARQVASNALTLTVGNGTARNSVAAAYPIAETRVASAGWDASNMFVGINNTETSAAKTVNCNSANTASIGVLTGTTNPLLGSLGPLIVISNALPTPSERAVLRRFVASLSGVTL